LLANPLQDCSARKEQPLSDSDAGKAPEPDQIQYSVVVILSMAHFRYPEEPYEFLFGQQVRDYVPIRKTAKCSKNRLFGQWIHLQYL